MANIEVKKDSKLINVFAEQVQGKAQSYETEREQAEILHELTKEMTPENRHQIAQIVGFTVERLQEKVLDPFSQFADIKNIGYGDKAQFKFKDKDTIRAYKQAKGSTTARSYAAPEQTFTMDTFEISARPAIHIGDLRTGRVNMTDLIKEANEVITKAKIKEIETVLQAGISTKASPYYQTGLNKTNLDNAIAYWRRLGPVSLVGDYNMTSRIAQYSGWSGTTAEKAPSLIEEYNRTGITGIYNGCPIITLENTYAGDSTTPVYAKNWLYIVPGGITPDMKNLKIVNEGGIQTMEAQNIDDLTYEIRLDTWLTNTIAKGRSNTSIIKTYRTAGKSLELKNYNAWMKYAKS